jgi:glucan phosphorylase
MHSLDSPAAVREALRAIAGNLSFTWLPDARALFEELDPERFAALDHNPTALVAELSDDQLARAATEDYLERLERVLAAAAAEAQRRTWWERRGEDNRFGVAYFSAEFGLDGSLPIYSGGLGVLAGDHLKSASDLGVPLVGVGLFYREGYFRQQLNDADLQEERYPRNDPARLPVTAEPVSAVVELADESATLVPVAVSVWRVQVGRVTLYLLDTDVDGNPDWARTITDKLYGGDRLHRLRQELVLGLGGVRVLRALGWSAFVRRRCSRRIPRFPPATRSSTRRSSNRTWARSSRAAASRGTSSPRWAASTMVRRDSVSRRSRFARRRMRTGCPSCTARCRARCGTASGRAAPSTRRRSAR